MRGLCWDPSKALWALCLNRFASLVANRVSSSALCTFLLLLVSYWTLARKRKGCVLAAYVNYCAPTIFRIAAAFARALEPRNAALEMMLRLLRTLPRRTLARRTFSDGKSLEDLVRTKTAAAVAANQPPQQAAEAPKTAIVPPDVAHDLCHEVGWESRHTFVDVRAEDVFARGRPKGCLLYTSPSPRD